MASGRFCYLDGVDFAINPLFQIEDLTKNNSLIDYGLNLALKYDLSKAKTIVNCKYEYEHEKNTLKESDHPGATAARTDDDEMSIANEKATRTKSLSLKSTRKKSMSSSISDENALTTSSRHIDTIERIKQDIDYHGLDDQNDTTVTKVTRKKNGLLKSNNQLEFSNTSKRNKNHTSTSSSAQDTQTMENISSSSSSSSSSNGIDITPYAKQSLPSQTEVQPVAFSPRLYMLGNFSNLLEPIKKSSNTVQTPQSATVKSDDINNNNNRINNINNKSSTLTRPSTDLINFDLATRSSLDPFHDMELKTINDLEELKNILENQQQQQQQQQQQKTQKQVGIDLASTSNNNASSYAVDNFGLPKISFVDLDLNKS